MSNFTTMATAKMAGELAQIQSGDHLAKITLIINTCLLETNALLIEYHNIDSQIPYHFIQKQKQNLPLVTEDDIQSFSHILISSGSFNPLVIMDLSNSFDSPEVHRIVAETGISHYIGYPIQLNGQITGILSLFFDETVGTLKDIIPLLCLYAYILGQEEASWLLQVENESLIQKSEEKDQFISLIVHDLKSPFNGFMGLTYLLTDELDNLSREEMFEISSSLRKSADNMFALLENLLEWSRIQRNVKKFEPQYVLLQDVVNQTLQHFAYRISLKQTEIYTEIPENLLLFTDSYMTTVILRNLISNAIKFSKKGSEILIKAKALPSNQAEICIIDQGTGIQDEIFTNLFRINELVKKPGTDGESGSGLGLLISRNFIEKHGGMLFIETQPDKGTTVVFTLPLLDERTFV